MTAFGRAAAERAFAYEALELNDLSEDDVPSQQTSQAQRRVPIHVPQVSSRRAHRMLQGVAVQHLRQGDNCTVSDSKLLQDDSCRRPTCGVNVCVETKAPPDALWPQ